MKQIICFFVFFLLSLISQIMAQDRAPHGLAYQNPTAYSPMTYDFFHPNSHQDPCASSNCSPLPIAAQVRATQDDQTPETGTNIKVGSIIGPGFVALVVLCLAMAAYYVLKTRQANVDRSKCAQLNV